MKYKTIYADPPWELKAGRPFNGYKVENGKQIFNSIDNRSRNLAYPTMSVNDIKKLPVQDIIQKDAHLYLWTTNKYLPHAFEVITSWGFNYSTTLVWAKNPMGGGLGGAFRITTEFLLFAKRGKLPTKNTHIGTWFNHKRAYVNGYPNHSKKPEVFAELIEHISPGPYLEMFARQERKGWHVFGNEVDNSIIL